MASIHVFNGISSDDIITYHFTGSLREHLPTIHWDHTIILRSGYRITPDYAVQDDDIIFIRMLPKDPVTIGVIIGVVVVAVAVGVAAGVAIYQQRKNLEEMEKAQRAAKAAGEKTQRLPFVKGARNQAATGQCFPYTLGETLFTPYRLCPPHYSIAGDRGEQQYFNIVLECGFNDILIKKLNLKNTTIKRWSDTIPQNGIYDFDQGTYYDPRNKIEVRQTGPFKMDVFNKKIIGVEVNKEIPHDHAGDDVAENARIEKEWRAGIVQELAAHPMAVEVIVLIAGCRKFENDSWQAQTIALQPEWTNEPDAENPPWYPFDSAFYQNGTYANTFEYNTKKHMRYSAVQVFTAAQSYGKKISVRLTRTTPKSEKNSQENVYLLAVQTTCYDTKKSTNTVLVPAQPLEPHVRDKCTRIGIRIAANENTTDMLDSFSVIQTGCARIWDSAASTWTTTKTPTRNLAAWVLELLTSPHHNPSRYNDAELDLTSFGSWYEYCEKEGFYADGIIARAEKKKNTIEILCQNGNAALLYSEFTGKIEVAIDSGRDYSVALLNSENIISIQNTKTFKRKTDGKKVTYINRNADYDIDSVTFMRSGKPYTPETDSLSVTALKYITDYTMAYKYVWRQMAEESAQPRTIIVKVGAEGAYYPLFSRVEVQHKTLPVGLSHGIITAVTWQRGVLKTLTLDGLVDFPNDKACGLLIHCVNNHSHGVCALHVSGSGKTNTLTVETLLSQSADCIPAAGDAFSFGTLDNNGGFSTVSRTMKIVNVEPADYGYTLTLKDYNPALYQYGSLPEYKSSITHIPDGVHKQIPLHNDFITRDELKTAHEQALKEAAQAAVEKTTREAAQEAANVITYANHFTNVHRIHDMALSLEEILAKIDEDARTAADGISCTEDAIILKVEDTEKALRSYIAITKDKILQRVEDDAAKMNATIALTKEQLLAHVQNLRNELVTQLTVQAGVVQALVEGGGSQGQLSLSLELPIMIDAPTRAKFVKASSEAKVAAVYARVINTDYYGIKAHAPHQALKALWHDARSAALLASQFSVEADQIQFKSDNVFVNGKLKAAYIDAIELAAKKTFTDALTVKRLHIDSQQGTHQDFEAWFDETHGLLIKNKGKQIFKVDHNGAASFSGEIECQGFRVVNTGVSHFKGDLVFTWNKGNDAHQCLKNIEKVSVILIDKQFDIENPIIKKYYGIGTYGSDTIRCISVHKYRYFETTRVELTLLSGNGEKKGFISSYADSNGKPITTGQGWIIPDPRYNPSRYPFSFYQYIPQQFIYLPNISYGLPNQSGILYRDEQGFLKIS